MSVRLDKRESGIVWGKLGSVCSDKGKSGKW